MNAPQRRFEVSPQLAKLRIPLAKEARDSLKSSISEHGVLAPLIVGKVKGKNILVDGHTRAELCEELGLVADVVERAIENEDQLAVLFVQIQLARRSLPEIGESYLRGTLYLERKRQGARSTSRQSGERSAAEALAVQFGTSPRTIERDGHLARAMKNIETALGENVRNSLCSGEINVTRREVEELSKMGDDEMHAAVARLSVGGPLASGRREWRSKADTLSPIVHSPRCPDPTDNAPPPASEVPPLVATAERPDTGETTPLAVSYVLPDLAASHEELDLAKSRLRRVLNDWRVGPGREVDGALERLESAIDLISKAHDILEHELIRLKRCDRHPSDPSDGFRKKSRVDARDVPLGA